jgi:hypothetical protein
MDLSMNNTARYSADAVRRAAESLGVEEAALLAVIEVEAAGRGHVGGKIKALFEPHKFYAELRGNERDRAVRAGLAYRRWGEKPYPRSNGENLDRVRAAGAINREAALASASWGLPQIMGGNYRAAGYGSASEMVEAFLTGEDEQIAALARFIKSEKLDAPLRRKDWAAFARRYNGPGYAKNSYDTRLASAYNRHARKSPRRSFAAIPSAEASEPAVTAESVRYVQERLKALGYHEVGMIDGEMGSRTRGAILAFRADNDMPLSADIDPDLIGKLLSAPPRPIDEKRAKATVADLAQHSDTMREAHSSKLMALFKAVGGFIIAGFYGVLDFFGDAADTLRPAKEFLDTVPGWAWALIAGVVAYVLYRKTARIEQDRLAAHREGRHP